MASSLSLEILDLRHFAASLLQPVLEAESEVWRQRLNWDYLASAKLLLQYLDSRTLPGYVALDGGRVSGYIFCVYEDTKAVIGDVFALPSEGSAIEIESSLLRHLIELLLNSPGIDRVESQLLLHPDGPLGEVFKEAGFEVYRRLYLRRSLLGPTLDKKIKLPSEFELRPWQDLDLNAAGKLIAEAYWNHPDSRINDQYRTVYGSQRFLHNIVRFPGCGTFSPQASQVVVEKRSREIVGLLLGSRVNLQCGHITQVCVHPNFRRQGIARAMLHVAAAQFQRLGMTDLTLTVTEANVRAVQLYLDEGYTIGHTFNAAVWIRPAIKTRAEGRERRETTEY